MNKTTTNNASVQSNKSLVKQKALVVIIICIITALVITASLIIALYQPPIKTPADLDNEKPATSTTTIRNGDFAFVSDDSTGYPMTASNWTKYTHKVASGTSQGYQKIYANTNTVMGVVDTADWETVQKSLTGYSLGTIANPNKANDEDEDSNVYMISNKEAYTASIYSQSFTIPASTSVKISIDMRADSIVGNAFAMVKQSSVSALEQSSSGTQQWYAHSGVADDKGLTGTTEWQTVELHVFNTSASSRTVYVNVGLGNVYDNTTATGTLFIDNITYETVTADAYRQLHDDTSNSSYVIKSDKETAVTSELTYNGGTATATTITTADYLTNDYSALDGKNYSPFIEDANIKIISNDGTVKTPLNLVSQELTVDGPVTGQHYSISVWVRVSAIGNAKNASANLYLYNDNDTLISSFATIQTDSDLAEHDTNGWNQYYFYIKPGNNTNQLSLKATLGDEQGYINSEAIPQASLLITEPVVTQITSNEYSNATSDNYLNKIALLTGVSSTNVNNGSFSSIVNNSVSGGLYTPNNWTPVYAGSAELFNSGKDNILVDDSISSVTSGIALDSDKAPSIDDSAKGVLSITNNVATSYGYMSDSIKLTANTVYGISVLVRSDDTAVPNLYLFDNKVDGTMLRLDASSDNTTAFDGGELQLPATDSEWTRYYFVYVTGDTAETVKLALFNGAMDATATTGLSTGTVLFDQATVQTLGSYTRDTATDDLYEKDADGNYVLDDNGDYKLLQDLAKELTFTGSLYTEFDVKTFIDSLDNYTNVEYGNVSLTDINEPTEPEEEEEEEVVPEENTTDPLLLISIISSALLVGALLIVVVVKFFKRKK